MSDEMLSLKTRTAEDEGEGGHFEVDDVKYALYSADEVSRESEAEMLMLFQRLARLGKQLEASVKDEEIRKTAELLRSARTDILIKFTSMPEDVVSKLGYRSQLKLLDVIGKDLNVPITPDEDKPEG